MKTQLQVTDDFALIPIEDAGINYVYNRKVGDVLSCEIVEPRNKKRTLTQNSAIHKYFELLADGLNDAGYDVTSTIKIPVSFTPDTVKKYLFKPVMTALFPDKNSTTELSTIEVNQVYEELNRLTGEKFGVSLVFPSYFNR